MQRRKVCRYFQRGSCKKDNCPFVHIKENRKACAFYMEGTCKKGINCNFYHPPKEEQKLNNLKNQLKKNTEFKKKKVEKVESEHSDQGEHQKIENANQRKEEQNNDDFEDFFDENKPAPVEQVVQQKIQGEQNIDKQQRIDFLLGFNQYQSEESDQPQEKQQEIQQQKPHQKIQFTKIYLKKFPDFNKQKQMKEKIKQNELRFFKGQKYIDVINRLQDPTEKEYYQIIRKYTDHFTPIEGDFFHFIIKMRPLLFQKEIQLHFQFIEDTFDIEVDGQKYPKERAQFKIINLSIPQSYKEKMLEFVRKYHENKSVVDTLKFVQNNFERLYKESHFKLQNQFYSKKQLEKKIKEQKYRSKESTRTGQNPKKKRIRAKKQTDSNPFVKQFKCEEGQKIPNLTYSYELVSDSILLQNCEYVVIDKLLTYLECVCEQKIMYILDASQDRSLKFNMRLICKKCKNQIVLGIQREVVQVRREQLGKVGVVGGHLLDVGGMALKVGCICSNEIAKGKLYLPGQRININCHHCFHAMHIQFMGLTFYNPTLKIPQVRMGHQLPNKGVCKHMKLTFRWYRYGCCGRCFSCDDCHIMGSIAVHEKIKGITMICGLCSREQILGDVCAFCHKQLVKGVEKTGHWQGGYGCRDQTALSRKDNKKYTGLTKKKQKEK